LQYLEISASRGIFPCSEPPLKRIVYQLSRRFATEADRKRKKKACGGPPETGGPPHKGVYVQANLFFVKAQGQPGLQAVNALLGSVVELHAEIPRRLAQHLLVVAVHAADMVDVRAEHELFFPALPVVGLKPDVRAGRLGAVH